MPIQLPLDLIRRRQELTKKLRDGKISSHEAMELRAILEKEKELAAATDDLLAIIAIIGLLAIVASFLMDDSKNKKRSHD